MVDIKNFIPNNFQRLCQNSEINRGSLFNKIEEGIPYDQTIELKNMYSNFVIFSLETPNENRRIVINLKRQSMLKIQL